MNDRMRIRHADHLWPTVLGLCLVLAGCDDDERGREDDARDDVFADVPVDVPPADLADGSGGDGSATDLRDADGPDGSEFEDVAEPDLVETVEPRCGDGRVDPGEACDGAALGGSTCEGLGFLRGTLACSASCTLDTVACTNDPCGNGVLDAGESCDGAALAGSSCADFGYATGTLACDADCQGFALAGCTILAHCGDGVLDEGELCDGDALGAATCADLGYDGGALGCLATCDGYETAGCHTTAVCGNGVIEGPEVCDGEALPPYSSCTDLTFREGTTRCTPDCRQIDISDCIINWKVGWTCSPRLLGDGTCDCGCGVVDFDCADATIGSCDSCNNGFTGGCGDPGRVCPGNIRPDNNAACEDTEYTCGDGVLEFGETCDGAQIRELMCSHANLTGTLLCNSSCTDEDFSTCQGCGNGIIEPGEQCDGINLGEATCATAGFVRGTLSCASVCKFETEECTYCPHDVLEPNQGAVPTLVTHVPYTQVGLSLCFTDDDEFVFDVTPGDRLVASITYSRAEANLDIWLFDATGAFVDVSDDAPEDATTATEVLHATIGDHEGGTWMLKIGRSWGESFGYNLAIDVNSP